MNTRSHGCKAAGLGGGGSDYIDRYITWILWSLEVTQYVLYLLTQSIISLPSPRRLLDLPSQAGWLFSMASQCPLIAS